MNWFKHDGGIVAEIIYKKLQEKEKDIDKMSETELKQYIEDVIEAERQLNEAYKKVEDKVPTKEKVSENGIKTEIIAPIESGIKTEVLGTPTTLQESIQKYFDTNNQQRIS